MQTHSIVWRVFRTGLLTLVLAGMIYGGYQYVLVQQAYIDEVAIHATLSYEADQLSEKLKASDAMNADLRTLNTDMKTLLEARQSENNSMAQQVNTLSSTVGVLDKLTKTDKQLLEKYSSVYFLNENYVPAHLSPISADYLNRPDKPEQILTEIARHVNDLLTSAKTAGIPLQVLSGYRSYGAQASLKSGYKMSFGSGTANAFSADQGYSEHQLGTTIDFTTPKIGAVLTGFDSTPSFAWLKEHAYEYGFILSYPKGNGHFVFEPWHWRYIGITLAKRLHDEGKNFYDLDQRSIDNYLVNIFD